MITLIAAVSLNNVIGKDLDIPWRISEDLKRFKNLTTGHNVVMGRKTYESLGKPLPNRTNVVVTSRKENSYGEDVITANSLENAISKCNVDCEIFIIGGGQLYAEAIKFANKIYLTRVLEEFDGNIFFPEINSSEWNLINYQGVFHNPSDGLRYVYLDLQRV